MATLFLFFLPLLLTQCSTLASSMSTISAISKDQIACQMCASCDNPCQPILSPPPVPSPPPPVPSPPPPVPILPPPTITDCPPPPAPPSGGGGGGGSYYYSPPPPVQPTNFPPNCGGACYPPNFVIPPPPNPIVPYFPYYYYNPPPQSFNSASNLHSLPMQSHALVVLIIVLISLVCLI